MKVLSAELLASQHTAGFIKWTTVNTVFLTAFGVKLNYFFDFCLEVFRYLPSLQQG